MYIMHIQHVIGLPRFSEFSQ